MWRLSLREMLVLVTLVALAIVSLTYASNFFRGAIGLMALLVYVGSIVAAFMDHGRRQAFAIGMALVMTIYGLLLVHAGYGQDQNYELVPYAGYLPTSTLLYGLFDGIVVRTSTVGSDGGTAYVDTPDGHTFLVVGHCWWALVFGYIGGRFAQFLYTRRMRESAGESHKAKPPMVEG